MQPETPSLGSEAEAQRRAIQESETALKRWNHFLLGALIVSVSATIKYAIQEYKENH